LLLLLGEREALILLPAFGTFPSVVSASVVSHSPTFARFWSPSNEANGKSDIEGKVAREAASEWSRRAVDDIDGKTGRSNGTFEKSDIEGKAAMGSSERAGKRTSFKWAGAHESMWATSEFQSKHWHEPTWPVRPQEARVERGGS